MVHVTIWHNSNKYNISPINHNKIYERLRKLGYEQELASDAASWCELACIGETYYLPDGEIEIEE